MQQRVIIYGSLAVSPLCTAKSVEATLDYCVERNLKLQNIATWKIEAY
jgi:hypothetical protein